MKYLRIFSIATSAVALLVLAGCSDELDKSDYNYFVEGGSTQPILTVAVSNPLGTTVDYTGTLDLASYPDSSVLDMGCMCSTDSLFRYGVIANSADDFSELTGMVDGLEANTNYFARAYVMTNNGIAYSPAVKFKTRVMKMLLDYSVDSLKQKQSAFSSIDKDGDGEGWMWDFYDEEGTKEAFISFSWYGSALEPENYLLFPAVSIPSEGVFPTMSVKLEPADPKFPFEVFKIVVSENPITAENCRDATELMVGTLAPKEKAYSVNLPASYIGKTAYMALCHYNCSDNFALLLKGYKVALIY